ncbi:hypothetical protein C5B42_00720 [Candidatus Cerribacteria bacterium 'Amazon FNV 2010 28 9']|uniref:Recombinase family protein n=1 Tax=Candidatus Cerribacteria bacterium 'Amazon FNV 2010 28 9' TaxID=2081795 RepID=A0A317JQF2_9BACT|nr:MAG: hypothetical protein C5B42_00720 [Candidatus Cerribacteria bacterium 'Amazon FNV 2010 28 9']
MKIAFIYRRVSTEEQADEGKSIETQELVCRKWAKDNDYFIAPENVFTDEGKSATTLNRPALKDMLAKCQDDNIKVDAVIVQDTDRLARNTFDHLTIKAILEKRNIRLISVSQPMIDNSPEGNLVDTIIASVNAFQSQITGRKTSKVLEQKAKMGWYPGGTPPLGYKNVDNLTPTGTLDKRIIGIEEETMPYIKKSFEMYATGNYTVQQIADYLNENKIKPVYGREIHESYVARMYRNEFYIGKFLWNNEVYEGKHPLFITKSLFMKVGTVLDTHNQFATRKRRHDFLLRGFLFCQICGSQMWAEQHTKKTNGNVYNQYFCPQCRKGSYVDRDKLEAAVEKTFRRIQISDAYVQHVLTTAKRILEEDRTNQDTETKRLTTEKVKVERGMKEAEDARFITHTLTEEAFNRIYSRYEKELKNIEDVAANLKKDHSKSIAVLQKVLRLAENIGQAYADADFLLKKNYLGIFFKRFIIKEGKLVKFDLTDELKPLIKNGSVRVRTTGLPD